MKEQKTSVPGIFKVGEGVLLNKDNASLQAYKTRKFKDKQLESLTEEMKEIREILNILLINMRDRRDMNG